jgi:hypothetical protein
VGPNFYRCWAHQIHFSRLLSLSSTASLPLSLSSRPLQVRPPHQIISSHFKSRAGGGGVEPVAYYQLQDGTVPPVPVVVSGVEASLFQSEAASIKIKNKNLNVNISAVEGQGRREKKPGLSWIEIWLEGEIWAADKKRKEREEGGYVGGGGKKKK